VTNDPALVVRAYVDACNAGDLEGILALLDPEFELHESPTLPGAVSAVGIDAVTRYLERFGAHWSHLHWEPLELRSAGDRVHLSARLELEGRRSGIAVTHNWEYVFTVRAGKLLRQDGFDDPAEAEAAFRG
jgi:ketosteroid isomerase-like protein